MGSHHRSGCTYHARHQHCSRCNAELYRSVSRRVLQKQPPRHGHPYRISAHQLDPEYSRTVPRTVTDMELLPDKSDLADRRPDGTPPGSVLRHLSDIISGRSVHISYPCPSICLWRIFCLEEMAGRRKMIRFFQAQSL